MTAIAEGPCALVITWLGCLLTAWQFGPSAWLLQAVVPAILIRHFIRPYPHWWSRFASAALHGLVLLAPLTIGSALFKFWVYGVRMHCCIPPEILAVPVRPGGPPLASLYTGVEQACSFAGACLYITAALAVHLACTGRLGARRLFVLRCLFLAAWVPFAFNPCGIADWIMD